ncbi:MAG: hypothetical protein A2268_16065 [Candidatus Raymondbacteria bacterium RifOxyA12_full_50_37]|uniref:Glycosyltransferase 2-like domain-containing protein n=1 Tax=Candidatus Raymondbacteria bacterium RIFOXYD12_FULL_49_13 TaxID=1817890 RepID=A0A1F7FC90_UNCRA|nr:MAG: hypothetical protein A2268_16065 [Candidatus Raymondbacteria bacterium RifOxyA12_full_50_37]OGJ92437.1 MAG: hypothetical protein A2248_11545 [Candidatus Raymondbacteria bacterium RIFOXYA2_FULL_49_16]OGJ94498.1 MAG: hypothetical protein A2350_07875 [Candidatus Raymondbacteria bacterium RifOxyB12_full_50_8]OGJ95258.1 MAG: hypothetical protein A2453_05685 [Candidatus Raymondbacteria bacterium RIFOXYC2_FULL_50_21]OGK04097.1 MAG: hypothetical protein A2519_19530 [Candidatus Raymondbacteria b
MAESPLVSVIIPTYNRCKMVEQAVASILCQTYAAYECIVVDDGSTDSTASCLQERFGSRITVLQQENRGVSAARNVGIRAAQGRFIAFLDSDDEWKPEKLRNQVDFMAANPGLRICQTNEVWMRKGVRVNPRKDHCKKAGDIFAESLERCMITPSSVLCEKSLLEETGLFDENLPACEDYDLWLRVTCAYEIGLVPELLLVRNGGRPDQLSAQHSLDKYRIMALKKLLVSNRLSCGQVQSAFEVFARKCRIYGEGCIKRSREDEGRDVLRLPETISRRVSVS